MEAIEKQTAPMTTFARAFHDAGFGIIRQAINADLAIRMRARLVDMLPSGGESGPVPLQRMVPCLVEQDEMFLDLATSGPLVATMREIFNGVVPHLVCSYGHEKPARTAAHTAAHSDVSHLPGVPHDQSLLMVKVMLALTPVTSESGPTALLPGSHRHPTDMAGVTVPVQRMLLEPGDLMLFHANIRHSATENSSNVPRFSVWLVYAQPWMRTFHGFKYTAPFLEALRPRISQRPELASIFGLTDPYATGRPVKTDGMVHR